MQDTTVDLQIRNFCTLSKIEQDTGWKWQIFLPVLCYWQRLPLHNWNAGRKDDGIFNRSWQSHMRQMDGQDYDVKTNTKQLKQTALDYTDLVLKK